MPLISFTDVSVAFGLQRLLDGANLQIDPGERVCLVGRNGEGKSTLLRLAAGEIEPDAGQVWRRPNLKMARLEQDRVDAADATVFDLVAGGLGDLGALVRDYHAAVAALGAHSDAEALRRVETLQHELEARDGWTLSQQVESVLSRLALPADTRVGALSGGWQRRAALARALVSEPELLLLDEPTNHLDIETIRWLEERLLDYRGGLLFVTHDRALLQRLATRILELDRGRLTSWPGDYSTYLQRRAAALEEEARQAALFDKRLAAEEVWIRQGIKARRTRNEGRVRALEALREARRQRRERTGRARIEVDAGQSSGQLVLEAENIRYAWDDKPAVKDLSLRVMRGDRIGLIGPNGAGKTTLLRLLLGDLEPQGGRVRHGTRLEVAYFDQQRAQLDPESTVVDAVAEGRESISVGGRTRHIMGYLADFLFSPARARVPVRSLSGGERNRLLLARLFSQSANLLVMDEPTNDLDIETLELLEEQLMDFPGTLLLVSHDRAFLDNVVTSTLVFEGEGRVREYVGGYGDWLRQRPAPEAASPAPAARPAAPAPKRSPSTSNKLGYKAQRELDQLPGRIEALEAEQAQLNAQACDPALYQAGSEEAAGVLERLAAIEAELAEAYERWEALEARRG